ncbi:MAG: YqgE/AlgH family protein [Proteobacteria bacterium]|nr:YqgE/AlgH family protein [Pseudomonadota bacterium]MBU1686439.1 YqgE/AlgH family protein [Pseudomonadota bacterium]
MESLQGCFLIATTRMPDPRFQKQVVYICAHSTEEGAMGLVINHPTDHNLAEVMAGADLPVPPGGLPEIYLGGPVEPEAGFFLFSSEYETEQCIKITESTCLSNDIEILRNISRGCPPARYLFALGYSGWAPGQLESELTNNGWLTLPANDDIIFDTPDSLKWQKAANLLGIDITTFDDMPGRA